MNDLLILVDENDHETGHATKAEVHSKGFLHRAFSIFIFNDKRELLLQQRSNSKYHSAGLWTNTCCSHPLQNETTDLAAVRRLEEEMGIKTALKYFRAFQYKAKFENGLTENEIDHLFYGFTNQSPVPNPEEVSAWKWIQPQELIDDVKINPEKYTAWLRICIEREIFSELVRLV